MPRGTKKDKFFCLTAKKNGPHKGKMLFGTNYLHTGDITAKDLIDFLKEKNIDSSKVLLPSGFITTITV